MDAEAKPEMTAAQKIEACAADLGLTMTAVFVPWSQSRNSGEKHPSLNWRVTLHRNGRDVLTTDYMAGSGYAPGYKQGDRTVYRDNLVRWECENGRHGAITEGGRVYQKNHKPILPDLAGVLASLVLDSDVLDCGTFEEWAGNYGYDVDSRKAETIYRACLEIALKLRNGLGDDGLRALREACQDY